MRFSDESAIVFQCQGQSLVGILHQPRRAASALGVVIVVGGPQYRVGSHRQFVSMARLLADAGYPVLRFDYRGMGDSSGAETTFESIDDDIRAAIDAFHKKQSTMRWVVLLGLCDGASAALMYSNKDVRLAGLILMNPWVRTEAGAARAVVRHYYAGRLWRRSLWLKVFSGKLELRTAIADLLRSLHRSMRAGKRHAAEPQPDFLRRMEQGIAAFGKPVLLLLSGRDLTAREFRDLCGRSPPWKRWLSSRHVTESHLSDADHTFSSDRSLAAASMNMLQWLNTVTAEVARAPRREGVA